MIKIPPAFDFRAHILILGGSGVGKTTMWCRYCESVFNPYNCGFSSMDTRIKTIEVDGKRGRLEIWNTADYDRFGPLPHYYYRKIHGFIICYGVNNRESFGRVEHWMEEIRKHAMEDPCVILMGTKSDLYDERVVSIDEGRQLAESLGIKFFETSAKENLNIDEAFLELARDISEVLNKKTSDNQEAEDIQFYSRENKVGNNCFKCS